MSGASISTPRRQLWPRLLVLLSVAAVGVLLASVAFAGWTTINFGNSSIDSSAWTTTASYSDTNNSTTINDRDEISKAWVRYDGTHIYFRIDTIGSKILSSNGNRLVGAIDCNGDGDFSDPMPTGGGPDGDRLVVFAPDNTVTLYDGVFAPVGPVSGDYSDPAYASASNAIEWGVPLYFLYPACRGSIAPINIAWATGTGAGATIDKSASYVQLSNPMDYGDTGQTLPPPPATCGAPNTGLQCNGARHGIVPMTPGVPLRLGSQAVDADPGNLQSANSDADDINGTTPDDEGGIYPDTTDSWSDGSGTLNFEIIGAASARLGCWIDFDKNGIWTDGGEVVVNNATINSSTTSRGITIPGGLTWPNSFPVRCRVWQNPGANTPTPVPAPSGPIEFGEVEDHIWEFDANGMYISGAAPAPSAATGLAIVPSGTADVKLTWTNPSPNDSARLLGQATNPYFSSATGSFVLDTIDSAAPWEYTHANVRGAPAGSIYYTVYGRYISTEAATPSNRVGLFEFGLVKGQP
jgi:hypothetical protein